MISHRNTSFFVMNFKFFKQFFFSNYRILLIPFIWGPNYLVVFIAQWLWKPPKILEDIFRYILELSRFLVNTANILPIEKIIWNPTWLTCIKTKFKFEIDFQVLERKVPFLIWCFSIYYRTLLSISIFHPNNLVVHIVLWSWRLQLW